MVYLSIIICDQVGDDFEQHVSEWNGGHSLGETADPEAVHLAAGGLA